MAAVLTKPEPTSLDPCTLQLSPFRLQTQAAPIPLSAFFPPMMAVLPSAEMATEAPCWLAGPESEPTSGPACCVQRPPFFVQIHAAPALLLLLTPPTIAVLPSAETATLLPCSAVSDAP